MEPWFLVAVLVLGTPLVVGIWLIVRAVRTKSQLEELQRRVEELESNLINAQREVRSHDAVAKTRETAPVSPARPAPAAPASRPSQFEAMIQFEPEETSEPEPMPVPAPVAASAPIVPPLLSKPVATPAKELLENLPSSVAPPPPLPQRPPVRPTPPKPKPEINWEQFLGVKGLMWAGGVALFLFVAFIIQYSFQHNLIRPEIRMALGFVFGLALLVGGVILHRRKQYIVGAQTLCAVGVVALYAVTFACNALYKFPFFGPVPTFLFMVLITVTAFFVAARLNALVVAILGMLGGFMTPILLSTGQDNPAGLFGYIAILDVGLIFVALARRWYFLTAIAAVGTALMQIGWSEKFFEVGKYFEGSKIFIALAVFLGFNLLYLAASGWAKRRSQHNDWLAASQLGLAAVALAFTLFCFDFAPLAGRPGLMFGYVFLVDLMVVGLGWVDAKWVRVQPLFGLVVFGLLAFWTAQHLTNETLNMVLLYYFGFAVFHSALPAWWQRRQTSGTVAEPAWIHGVGHWFPPLALVLVLLPIFKLTEVSFLVWPFVLLVDLLAIALAVFTATLLPVLVVLLLTLLATGALIFHIPAELTGVSLPFWLIGAFAVFFVGVTGWLVRKFKPRTSLVGVDLSESLNDPETLAAVLPTSSVVLPFLLLIMATMRLPLLNPSPVYGLTLLLGVLLLGVAKMFRFDWLPLTGVICTLAVECTWHFKHFNLTEPGMVAPSLLLAWYLIFFALFAAFPFVFWKKYMDRTLPWAASALAGPAQFLLIYRLVKAAWPNNMMGLLPGAFALPALLSLTVVLKKSPAENPARLNQLAWFGGVALFFITLIFPVQFDRQWLTIGWALEGAALLWLFLRVPHPGLRWTGLGLLLAAFARLAFNPAVLEYHARSATPIFNWYFYTYGLATAAFFLSTRLVAPPRHQFGKLNGQALFASLGTVLAFLLLNIEIADYFSEPGSTLTFQFSGSFARDLSYSIAWGLFALGLLGFGMLRKIPAARYAALGLLGVTLLKLFFHDLASLNQLYRAFAFGGVAVIAMLGGFAYQKFFAAAAKPTETHDELPPEK